MTNIDELSKKIIYALSINTRKNITKLAKDLNESRRIVQNRVLKLYQEKIIYPQTRIIYSNATGVFIRLSKFDEDALDYIKKIKEITEIHETLGYYDLFFVFHSMDSKKLKDILIKIENKYSGSIINLDLLYNLNEEFFGYRLFLKNDYTPTSPILGEFSSFNTVEENLMQRLITNPNSSYASLSEATGFPYPKLKITLDKLRYKGVLSTIELNKTILPIEINGILIKIKNHGIEILDKYLKGHKNIFRLFKMEGRWSYLIFVTTKNMGEFIEMVRKIRTDFKDELLDFNTLILKNDSFKE